MRSYYTFQKQKQFVPLYLFFCVSVLFHSLHSHYVGLDIRGHPNQPGQRGSQLQTVQRKGNDDD